MIRIQNIYHMLAYAFQVLEQEQYTNCGTEPFDNAVELLSEILIRGMKSQLRRGLHRDYVAHTEALSCPRGKISISETLKQRLTVKQKLMCQFDEFTPDSQENRIIKTTFLRLLKSDLSHERKQKIKQLLPYLAEAREQNIRDINWRIIYSRTNATYRMLIFMCWLLLHEELQSPSDGSHKALQFSEKDMAKLYERFILAYYRREFAQLHPSAAKIEWALDDDFCELLPEMQSDITLTYENRALIIDAKYYEKSGNLQAYHGAVTQHSDNLYQMFTYVKNKAAAGYLTSGLILYAKTDEVVQPNQVYHMSGNTIAVKALDLNCDFAEIKNQLSNIALRFIAGEYMN